MWDRVRRAIAHEPFRRLSHDPEVTVPNGMLCQSMHVGGFVGDRRPILGGKKSQYYLHSLPTAKAEIDTLLDLGVRSVYLQLQTERADKPYYAIIDEFARVVRDLRETFGRDLTIAVDPQGICMGKDLRWGARDSEGRIDPELTLDILAEAAFRMAQAGMDAFTVIGRANYEAAVARRAIDLHDPAIELWSFSTNSETPNAYFDVTAYDVAKAQTGQKIIVGNTVEMVIRGLMDVVEGVDVMLQKPVENIYILSTMRDLLDGRLDLTELLGRERVQKLAADNRGPVRGRRVLDGGGQGAPRQGRDRVLRGLRHLFDLQDGRGYLQRPADGGDARRALPQRAGGRRRPHESGWWAANMLWFAETRKRLACDNPAAGTGPATTRLAARCASGSPPRPVPSPDPLRWRASMTRPRNAARAARVRCRRSVHGSGEQSGPRPASPRRGCSTTRSSWVTCDTGRRRRPGAGADPGRDRSRSARRRLVLLRARLPAGGEARAPAAAAGRSAAVHPGRACSPSAGA